MLVQRSTEQPSPLLLLPTQLRQEFRPEVDACWRRVNLVDLNSKGLAIDRIEDDSCSR